MDTTDCNIISPYRKLDGTCSTFNEVCKTVQDLNCINYKNVCRQCPLNNISNYLVDFYEKYGIPILKNFQINSNENKNCEKSQSFIGIYSLIVINILICLLVVIIMLYYIFCRNPKKLPVPLQDSSELTPLQTNNNEKIDELKNEIKELKDQLKNFEEKISELLSKKEPENVQHTPKKSLVTSEMEERNLKYSSEPAERGPLDSVSSSFHWGSMRYGSTDQNSLRSNEGRLLSTDQTSLRSNEVENVLTSLPEIPES